MAAPAQDLSSLIAEAVAWYREARPVGPPIPALQRRFPGLTTRDACLVLREVGLARGRAL